MRTTFAAVLFRPEEISDRALSQGFAVALAGYDVPAPHLFVAELRGIPGWSAAFYQSGMKLPRGAADEELDHACELFDDELSPAVCVLDAAAELRAPEQEARIYAIIYTDDFIHDDAYRIGSGDFERRYVREGESGLEAGIETAEMSDTKPVSLGLAEGATDEQERAAIAHLVEPHRGSTFLARELGGPVLGALLGALFAPDRRIAIRLVEPSPEAVHGEVQRLNRILRRTDGRGTFEPPSVGGVVAPEVYQAFVRAYDWTDPTDPQDLYRELAIGAVEGTLRFLREADLRALDASGAWSKLAASSLFPVAALTASGLGVARSKEATVALAEDREHLVLVRRGEASAMLAGPTFGELLRYLALGWKSRSDEEEDMIGALMLRAKIRASRA